MSPSLPPFSVSFVLATHNRGQTVVECLRQTLACASAVLPASRLSIVVVDNASTDGTPVLVAALAREHPAIRLIRLQKNCGPVAKNLGIHENPADIIVLLDDDAYPLPGALAQMLRHFAADPALGAAVFDVTLPNGQKEASAYPDVFIGAGTALRNAALRQLARQGPASQGLLPADFFMQAEEYDLSFRLLETGWSIQRFWDMPLLHLKTPGARIAQRTTRLDVRNNLFLLAKYIQEPLCQELAADWLARYWRMAVSRDAASPPTPSSPAGTSPSHKSSFMKGAAEGLARWNAQRAVGVQILSPATHERIFKFNAIAARLARLAERSGITRIVLGDLGKNALGFYRAAQRVGMTITAVVDDALANPGPGVPPEYRGIPLLTVEDFLHQQDGGNAIKAQAMVITALSRPHALRRAAAYGRILQGLPVIDLFEPRTALCGRVDTSEKAQRNDTEGGKFTLTPLPSGLS